MIVVQSGGPIKGVHQSEWTLTPKDLKKDNSGVLYFMHGKRLTYLCQRPPESGSPHE